MQLDICTKKNLKQTLVSVTFVTPRMNAYFYVLCNILVVIR